MVSPNTIPHQRQFRWGLQFVSVGEFVQDIVEELNNLTMKPGTNLWKRQLSYLLALANFKKL